MTRPPRARPGSLAPSVVAVVAILAMYPVITANDGCDGSSSSSRTTATGARLTISIRRNGAATVEPGGRVQNAVVANGPAPMNGMRWTFPAGATNMRVEGASGEVTFAGNTAYFAAANGATTRVSYDAPQLPPGSQLIKVVDTVQALADGVAVGVSIETEVTRENQRKRADGGEAGDTVPVSRPAHPSALDSEPTSWQASSWLGASGTELTGDLCATYLGFLQSPDVFFAVRFPLLPSLQGPTGSYTLPLVEDAERHPRISLLDYRQTDREVLTVPIELRPDRMGWLAGAIPPPAGERWMAFGLATDPGQSCPAGLPIPAGQWELYTELHLDFRGDASACFGCQLQGVLCYEGDTAPPILDGAKLLATVVEAGGITCLGPFVYQLVDGSLDELPEPPILLSGFGTARAAPGQRVAFRPEALNLSESALAVEVALASAQGLSWQLVEGSYTEPDLGAPIAGPVTLPARFNPVYLWAVLDFPAGAAGSEVVRITLTETGSQGQVSDTDLLWLGPWQPPPARSLPLDRAAVGEVDSTCP